MGKLGESLTDVEQSLQTTRRGIECDLISGIRDYMPEKANKTPAVWEWCIGNLSTADGVQKYMVITNIMCIGAAFAAVNHNIAHT